MELHDLKPADGSRKGRKRVGRGHGSGKGKTSGRGHKGQKARSGYSRRHGFEGGQMPLHRRLPKGGFRHLKRFEHSIVNVDFLDKWFQDGDEVTTAKLIEIGLANETGGGVKVLGRGELTKKLDIRVQAVSDGARKTIESAGGTVTIEATKQAKTEAAPAE
jgi:large subunit ribosomal protein L15